MKQSSMKATSLRSLLIFLLILVIAGIAAGFYYGLGRVREYAVEVSHTNADAQAAEQQVGELQRLKATLASSNELVKKANQLFATESSYQSRAIRDVQRYASRANITITDTSFPTGQQGSGSHTLVINLASPTSYVNFIRFLESIESNLPKMQVTGVDISRASGDTISVQNINIQVFTR
jgi:uncharacterized protein (UPF0333 family)